MHPLPWSRCSYANHTKSRRRMSTVPERSRTSHNYTAPNLYPDSSTPHPFYWHWPCHWLYRSNLRGHWIWRFLLEWDNLRFRFLRYHWNRGGWTVELHFRKKFQDRFSWCMITYPYASVLTLCRSDRCFSTSLSESWTVGIVVWDLLLDK